MEEPADSIDEKPVLYSFRRCPFAIRARLALNYSGIPIEIREVDLNRKPRQMLALSPKGTVPVLVLLDCKVIEESLDIMKWALGQHDPDHWLAMGTDSEELIQRNDGEFKYYLDRYKYADRYLQYPSVYYRSQAEYFVSEMDTRLSHHTYLMGDKFSLADAAIFPFIRQFAAVDEAWFSSCAYPFVRAWLDGLLNSGLFASVMAKFPVWMG